MNNDKRIVNEKWFIGVIKNTNKMYYWIDKSESYNIINHRKMKPATLKGYVELSAIVRRPFMDIFVELPDDTLGMSKEQIWATLGSI
tara:strand:+ start:551 stop:811 length:261 start_codon:yes stop_codon:yes gene_type:complete